LLNVFAIRLLARLMDHDPGMKTETPQNTAKVKVTCNECGKTWQVNANMRTSPQCSRCNSMATLTPAQQTALMAFVDALTHEKHRHEWKARLSDAWITGIYPVGLDADQRASLQSIRNGFGASWLATYKLCRRCYRCDISTTCVVCKRPINKGDLVHSYIDITRPTGDIGNVHHECPGGHALRKEGA
jgi:hypothetical protein